MRKFLCTSAVFLFAAPAFAAHWTVDAAKSTLTFTGSQSGDTFNGEFTKFVPVIDFDPTHPETGKIDVTVNMASVTIEGKDRTDALPTADWFAISQFPTAEFHSTRISSASRLKSGGPAFDVEGNLTIRGVTKPATLSFELVPEGTASRAKGTININRSDYKIGQGRWASDQWIAYPVTVNYSILATKAK